VSFIRRFDIIRQIRHWGGFDFCLVNGNVEFGKGARATFSILDGDITIGENSLIAPFCVIVSNCHVTKKSIPVSIGRDVWIGAHSTITQGCIIGDGAVIGANSCLTRNTYVRPGELWGGVPARRIR